MINLYMSDTAQLENVEYYEVSSENKKTVYFNQLFGCPKINFDLE